MNRFAYRAGAAVAIAALAAGALAACTSSEGGGDGVVEIKIGDLPSTSNPELREGFLDRVAAFEKANPDIRIEAVEDNYEPTTFAAQLAGGTLPTGLMVPLTEIQSLIAREQLADLSAFYEESDALASLAEPAVAAVQDSEGAEFGIPVESFALGLLINRGVIEEAGIDPDSLTFDSWDDVSEVADTVAANTDAGGLAFLSKNNQGGWITAAVSAAFGGSFQTETSDGKWESSLTDEGVVEALEYIHQLRWEGDALGDDFLMEFAEAGPAFAAGEYAMMIGVPGWYEPMNTSMGLAPEDFGVYPLPQQSAGLGSLGGGGVGVVRADATEEEAAAAVAWFEFQHLAKFTDEDAAKTSAEADDAGGRPVPAVALPLVDSEQYQTYLGWVNDWVNIPVENIAPFTDAANDPSFVVVGEPPVEAQQVYGIVDSVLQAVLTDESADIAGLLQAAQDRAAPIVESAQK